LGVVAWGFAPHPPTPKPQSPIPNPQRKMNLIENINKKKYYFLIQFTKILI